MSHVFVRGPCRPSCSRLDAGHRAQRDVRVNITNTKSEVWPDGHPSEQTPTGVKVSPRMPRFEKYKGPLERKVSRVFEDALFDDRVDMEEVEYWFGDNKEAAGEDEYLEYLDVVEEEQGIMTARNEEGEGRANLANFRPGQVLTGTVTEISIIHGLKVDIGAEYDVIIPMRQDAPWKTIAKDGSLEAVFMKEVPLTIAQVKDPYRYRWPLVGFLHEGPDLPGMIDAYDFKVPICLYEGDQLGAVAKEVGRKYVRAKFYMEIEKEPTVFPHMEEELAEGGKPDPEAKFDEFMMEVRKDLGL